MSTPAIIIGASTHAIFKPRPTKPIEGKSHPNGFTTAKTRIAGASSRKIGEAAIHFAPNNTKITASEKNAQAIVIGTVIARTSEYPLRKYVLSRLGSFCKRESAENATSEAAEFKLSVGMFAN